MENNRYREEELEETCETESEEAKNDENHEPEGSNVGENTNTSTEHDSKRIKKQNKKIKKLEEENQQLKEEIDHLKDQLLRERAELENFKKRMNEEKIRERKYALSDFLMQLIDVVDIFDKAVNIKTDDEKLQKFLSGFVMVNKTFKQILERNGVEQSDALNKPFNPTYHSAIETVKVEGVEPNTVVEVIMTGYTYKDRVLRPSMVKVSE